MKVCTLSSGSKGNCTYVETKNHKILIDIGNSCLYIEKALRSIGVDPFSLDLVLITHAHIDHIAGMKVFVKKYNPKIYMSSIMLKEANLENLNTNVLESLDLIEDINISDISLSHDTKEIKGYLIEDDLSSVVYITDTGYINQKNLPILSNKNLYIFESNHDIEMLMNNPNYPHSLKIRILSDKGHLSNKDSAYYLSKLIGVETKYIVLAHLSEHNNKEELAESTLLETLIKKGKLIPKIIVAKQNIPTELFEI